MQRLRLLSCVLGVLFVAGCQSVTPQHCAVGGVTLKSDFPAGASGICSVVDGATLLLQLQPENEPINSSPWYAFDLYGSGPVSIVLDYGDYKHRYVPKLSTDGESWQPLDDSAWQVSPDGRRLSMNLELDNRRTRVAAQEVMDSAWYDAWLAALSARWPHLQRQQIGESAQGRPLWMFETRPESGEAILLVGRQHPPEVSGAIAMQHFVERMLEIDPDINVVVVPLLNPDGVDLGHWRHNATDTAMDLNRDWGPFTQPETLAIRGLIEQMAARHRLLGFLDFHSTYRNLFYTQTEGDVIYPAAFDERWLQRAEQAGVYEFSHESRHNTGLPTGKGYMFTRYSIPAITYEVGDETDRAQIRASARTFADTYLEELAQPAPVDVLISGGTVVDGTGRAGRVENVGVIGDRIVYVGTAAPPAATVLDATGMIVSPGFIDPHTHSDRDLKDPARALNVAALRQGVTTVFIGNDGDGLPVPEVRAQLSGHGLGTNVALFIGHGAVRSRHVGDEDRAPTAQEMSAMKAEVARSMEAGALGLSTGLFYAPGSFAQTDEVVDLAAVAGQYNGVYESHLRDEGNYGSGLIGSVTELIDIARKARLPGHIAHIKALGPDVHGLSVQVIELVEQARQEGLQITADQYPWLASGTRLSNALLPRWTQDGGTDAMRARLQDVAVRPRLLEAMSANLVRRGGADKLLITGDSEYRGKYLSDVARETGEDALQAAIQIILAGDPAVASFMMDENDLRGFMARPWVVTGSDSSTGHPRKYGSFARKYQTYVRDVKLLTLPQFVQQSSGRTAAIFNLCDRGLIRQGQRADIAVWSPQNFRSMASYEQPELPAAGVRHVLVNGRIALRDAQLTAERGGKVLSRMSCP